MSGKDERTVLFIGRWKPERRHEDEQKACEQFEYNRGNEKDQENGGIPGKLFLRYLLKNCQVHGCLKGASLVMAFAFCRNGAYEQ